MSTMMTFASQNLENKFLTEKEIEERCPAAFLTEPTTDVSEKYVVARTIDVIRDLEKLGWKPVAACQRKKQKNSNTKFNFHMVVFQNPDVKIVKTVKDENGIPREETDCFPRIILTNSMDGCACFQFLVGLLRLVCSNGLVIGTDMFADMKIRHIHYTFEDLKELINKVVEQLPVQVSEMNRMQMVNLTEEQKKDFAKKAYLLRLGKEIDDVLDVDNDTLEDILAPTREEDQGDSLWNVLNVIQEKMVKGGFKTSKEGKKPRKVRALKSFITDMDFNKEFWSLAESYLPKEAA